MDHDTILRPILESLSREDLEFVSECCAVHMDENEPLQDHINDLIDLAKTGRVSFNEIIRAASDGA